MKKRICAPTPGGAARCGARGRDSKEIICAISALLREIADNSLVGCYEPIKEWRGLMLRQQSSPTIALY